jgi:hypothetical protein
VRRNLGCLGFFTCGVPDIGAARAKIVPDYL